MNNSSSANSTLLRDNFEFNDRLLFNVVCYSIMFVMGTIGNTVVCFLSHRQNDSPENKGRTNVHMMVLHLTLSDLIVSYIVIPLEIGWRLSVQVCCGISGPCAKYLFLIRDFCFSGMPVMLPARS
jgi:gonadotropin-releasing hormone receptor